MIKRVKYGMDIDPIVEFALPAIPEKKRVIPNDIIRSSLFTVSNHNRERLNLKNEVLFSFQNTDIFYTGEELRQDDEDVWLQLIYLSSQSQSSEIFFRPYTFMGELGWPKRTQYREKLKASLTRMSATDLKIHNKAYGEGIDLSLVRKFIWYDTGGQLKEWRIWLEPEVVKLFSKLGQVYSKIHWEQRKQLNPLAKWLHAFYSSHAEPAPMLVSRIMQLSGSKMKAHKHFKQQLRIALLQLCQVGFLESYFINESNQVSVVRIKESYKMNDNDA